MASSSTPETPILGTTFLSSEAIPSVASLQAGALFAVAQVPPSTQTAPNASSPRRSSSTDSKAAAVSRGSASSAAATASPPVTSGSRKRTRSTRAPVNPVNPVASAKKRARSSPQKKVPSEEEQDSKPAAQDSCCICMNDFEPGESAKINGCDHMFCFGCIEKWAERENSCPLCKARFNKIERVTKAKKKGQTNTKKVKTRDQRPDLPSAALEGLLASLARRGSGSNNVARLFFGSSSIAVGVRSGRPVPGSQPTFLGDVFGDSDDEETPFAALFRAFHNAPLPSFSQLRPVSVGFAMAGRSYASNVNDTTAGNEENPLTIDDDSVDEEEAVEVVDVRSFGRST